MFPNRRCALLIAALTLATSAPIATHVYVRDLAIKGQQGICHIQGHEHIPLVDGWIGYCADAADLHSHGIEHAVFSHYVHYYRVTECQFSQSGKSGPDDHIRAAGPQPRASRVKGLSELSVIWRHAFKNVLVQLITIIGLTYASLLEGSVLTETIFAWPGIGQYITQSLFNADMNAVIGGTVVVGIGFVGINMLSDTLYRFVDPRARA